MVQVIRDADRVVFEVKGLHKLWALKSRLEVPLASIRGARKDPSATPQGFRAPGTYLPGIITAGTFRVKGRRIFWDVSNPDRCIVIDLADQKFSQLVIEVEEPDIVLELLGFGGGEATR